jgi:monoterpene epsilon-lactone hydrolase
MSWQARLLSFLVRHRVKPQLGDLSDLKRVRKAFNSPLPAPGGVRYTQATVGGVRGEWVEADSGTPAADAAVPAWRRLRRLQPAHAPAADGGAGAAGPARVRARLPAGARAPLPGRARRRTGRVARALRADATPGRLVVAGDSAGGNLALGLMLALKDAGEPLPDAAALFSPATDLTGGSASIVTTTLHAMRCSRARSCSTCCRAYLGDADPAQPLAAAAG